MKHFNYQLSADPKQRKTHQSWYRGKHCNFIPSETNLAEADAIDRFVLAGWLPPAPFINRSMIVTSFGSCFAQHISRFLREHGYLDGSSIALGPVSKDLQNTHLVEFGEGIVNTFALVQQFEWALEGRNFAEYLWHGSQGQLAQYNEKTRDATRRIFEQTDVFILTLGLSEVWSNRQTGEAFWRAIPRQHFDPAIHGFHIATVQENLDNLEKIYSLIRSNRPEATVIFTLSPIPLIATFRPVSCITANCASKAILRAALDEFIRRHADDAKLRYWPAYELITSYFKEPFLEDNRHVKPQVLDAVMAKFAQHYLLDSEPDIGSRDRRRASRLKEVCERPSRLAKRLFDGFFNRQESAGSRAGR